MTPYAKAGGKNQYSKPKEETNVERQRRVLAELLVCKVCGKQRRYNPSAGFQCEDWLHEWVVKEPGGKLAVKAYRGIDLGRGKRERRIR